MTIIRKWTAFAALLCLLLLTGCVSAAGGKQAVSASGTAEYFGTVVKLTLYGEDEEKLNASIDNAFKECERLEKIFSARLADSELSALNQTAVSGEIAVSDELFYLMQTALSYNEMSGGCLDISIGGLIDLWGIGTNHARVPSKEEIDPFLSWNGSENIILDAEKQTVQYTDQRVQVDLGAIAKGYAADQLKRYLTKNEHINSAVLNLGGNVLVIGEKNGGDFRIGINDPKEPGELCAVVSVRDRAVVTSGNYERYFVEGGKRYHHILDPKTGYPAEAGLISATIIGDASAECDALSTACYILGKEKALSLIESLDGIECVLIDEDGELSCSSGMEEYKLEQLK